jgi:hypothetical protein
MKNNTKYFPVIGFAILLGVVGQAIFPPAVIAAPLADQDQSHGGFSGSGVGTERKHIAMVETQGVNTVLDIPLRLGGFAATLVGAGLFIGTSPITGIMTALRPHNAILKAADFLVVRPGNYTFVRPSGDFDFDSRSDDEK